MENLLTSTTTKTVRSRQQQCVNRCQLQCGHRYTVNCNGMLLSQINMNQAMNRTYSHVRNGSTAGRSITCKSQKKGQRVDKLYTQ